MQKKYEAPELTVIGLSDEVVMGAGFGGGDILVHAGSDFEFEHDSL